MNFRFETRIAKKKRTRIGSAVALVALVLVVGPLREDATASTGSVTFNATDGSPHYWTVPPGVASVNVDAQGGQGGVAGWCCPSPGGVGGLGGRVQATLSVTPGQQLAVWVGTSGWCCRGWNNGGPGSASCVTMSYGLDCIYDPIYFSGGGDGGGESDIRLVTPVGSGDRPPYFEFGQTLANRVLVAGGGGGASGAGNDGGAGGTTVGRDGEGGGTSLDQSRTGGHGGTAVAGGPGGTSAYCGALLGGPGGPGAPGAFGSGGSGGLTQDTIGGGGGGGGGWFGGGGGAAGCAAGGGGGGSSYAAPGLTSNVIHTQGYRQGDGVVTISWDTAAPSPTPLVTLPPTPTVSSGPAPTVPPAPTAPPTPTLIPGVGGYSSDDCDAAGTNIVSGFVDGTFAKAKTAPGGANTTWLCVAGEAGGAHVGGKLTLNASTPGLSVASVDLDNASVAACGSNANNIHVNGGQIANQPWFVDVTPSPTGSTDSAWVCVRMTNSVGFRLRFAPGVSIGLPSFAADSTSPHVPPYVEDPWPAPTQPSAACQLGGGTRLANLKVGSTPVALYTWQESATKANLCVRGGATGGAGARLTVSTDGVSTGITTTNSTSPCPFALFTSQNPSLGAFISNPSASLPVSACVAVGSTALGVTANAPTTGPVVTLQQDSA